MGRLVRARTPAIGHEQPFHCVRPNETSLIVKTMSYSVHRRKVADATVPLEHRASHVRSCALHVANKITVKRSAILEQVKRKAGVDLDMPGSDAALAVAFASIEALRSGEQKLAQPAV